MSFCAFAQLVTKHLFSSQLEIGHNQTQLPKLNTENEDLNHNSNSLSKFSLQLYAQIVKMDSALLQTAASKKIVYSFLQSFLWKYVLIEFSIILDVLKAGLV